MRGLGRALPKGTAMFVPFNCDVVIGEPLTGFSDAEHFVQVMQKITSNWRLTVSLKPKRLWIAKPSTAEEFNVLLTRSSLQLPFTVRIFVLITTRVKRHGIALKDFPVITKIVVAWGEMDALQHVNNVVYFRYFETARIDYFAHLKLMEELQRTQIGLCYRRHKRVIKFRSLFPIRC